jgi:uncharacterized protein YhaN
MKLMNLKVDGFGVWSQLELGQFSPHVTVIYGANEAGKTTLMQFMRAVLYGLSDGQRQRYLPPVHGDPAGGSLEIDSPFGSWTFSRRFDASAAADVERLTVVGESGRELPRDRWQELFTDVDEHTFQNVFAVGLRELQELGSLDDTEAAQLLYKLSTGLDRVSLFDVMRELAAIRQRLRDPHTGSGQIQQLFAEYRELSRASAEAAAAGDRWVQLQERALEWDRRIQELVARREDVQQALTIHDVAVRVRAMWLEQRNIRRSLQEMPPAREVPADLLERLEKLRRGAADRKQRIQELGQRRRLVRQQAAQQPVKRALWSQAWRIEGLAEHEPWLTALETQISQLQVDIRTLEAQLGSVPESANNNEEGPSLADLPDVSGRNLAALREPARTLREETQRRVQAAEELETSRQLLEQLTTELESDLLRFGYDQLPQAMEQVGQRVAQLRRRTQLLDQHDRLARQRDDLERQHQQLLERQVLSGPALAWLGVPFVAGVVLILSGLIWHQVSGLGWPVALLGIVGWASAVVAKIALERSAARELHRCEKQFAVLREKLQEVELEIEDLDERLPRGPDSAERLLAAAERELAELEDLLPKEASVQTARQKLMATQRRKERLDDTVRQLQEQWRVALRRAGLPDNLSPRAAKQLAAENRESTRLQRLLEIRREELAARQRELQKLVAEIEQTFELAQLAATGADPQRQIRQLVAELAEQKTLKQQRDQLRQQDRQIRQQGQRLNSQLRRLGKRMDKILETADVASEAELRRVVTRNRQRAELQERLAELEKQFETIAQQRCSWQQVHQHLEQVAETDLPAAREAMVQQLQQLESELAAANQRQGEIAQETRTLQADATRHRTQLMRNAVEHRLRNALRQWQVLTLVHHVLETVRVTFETERQPQTLCDASRYFSQLTAGKYTRIWTPLSEQSLRVDTAAGQTLPLEVLSSGTREAVFLSLRLALIADFARRGVVLPLILDDVLVNFDRRRAEAAAVVLSQFAQSGYQVLFFTCHEHIVELFAAKAAEIRCLPDYDRQHSPAAIEPETMERIIEIVEEPITVITSSAAPAAIEEEEEEDDDELAAVEHDGLEEDEEEEDDEEAWDEAGVMWEDDDDDDDEEEDGRDAEESDDEWEWEVITESDEESDEVAGDEADEAMEEDEAEESDEEFADDALDEAVAEAALVAVLDDEQDWLEDADVEPLQPANGLLEEGDPDSAAEVSQDEDGVAAEEDLPAEELPAEEEEDDDDDEEEEEEDKDRRRRPEQRFAWESPERWWTDGYGGNGGAAA